VRNYVEKQGIEVIEKLLEKARKISLEVLKGVKEIDLSIDLQQRRGTGNQ
jgi:putative transposase